MCWGSLSKHHSSFQTKPNPSPPLHKLGTWGTGKKQGSSHFPLPSDSNFSTGRKKNSSLETWFCYPHTVESCCLCEVMLISLAEHSSNEGVLSSPQVIPLLPPAPVLYAHTMRFFSLFSHCFWPSSSRCCYLTHCCPKPLWRIPLRIPWELLPRSPALATSPSQSSLHPIYLYLFKLQPNSLGLQGNLCNFCSLSYEFQHLLGPQECHGLQGEGSRFIILSLICHRPNKFSLCTKMFEWKQDRWS